MQRLALPDKLVEALDHCRRITDFEGRRRQMQFIGKLMRGLEEEQRQAVRDAIDAQHQGSAADTLSLHEAEKWRDDLIAREDALGEWLLKHPQTDTQQLRALIRQARKEVQPDQDAVSKGLAPRRGRAYRDIFQLVRDHLSGVDAQPEHDDGTYDARQV